MKILSDNTMTWKQSIIFIIVITVCTFLAMQLVYGQEVNIIVDKGDVRQFLELGEEKYRELCFKSGVLDDTTKDLLDYMPKDMEKELTQGLREKRCEDKINQIKNQTLGSILEDEK